MGPKAKSMVDFPSKQKFRHDLLLGIVKRTKENFISPFFES
jgi:hypothetical protein